MKRWLVTVVLLVTLTGSAVAETVTRETRAGPDRVHAELMLSVPVATLLPVLEQPCHVLQWMPDLRHIEVIERRPQANETLVHMITRGRWPLLGRDAVVRFRRDPGPPVRIAMTARPDALPRSEDHVRIPFSEGLWLLEERADGNTRVVYSQRLNPGGRIPQWLADRAAVDRVRDTVTRLRRYTRNLPDDPCSLDNDPS